MGNTIGKIFTGPLTKAGVSQPSGQTTYYDSPQAATEAASKQLPSAETILGSDVLHPENNVPALPKVVQPTFSEALDDGHGLTRKGQVLSMLISGIEGVGAGAAAASQGSPRTGYPSPLVGLAAGFDVPRREEERRLMLRGARLRQQKEQAEISALPQEQELDRQLKQSEVDRNNAIENRKEIFQVAGGGLYQHQDDGTLKELHPPNHQPSVAEQIANRQQLAEQMDFPTEAAKNAFISGTRYSALNDVDSAEFKERQRVANQRDQTSRANASQRKLSIKAKSKDAFAQFGGKGF